MDTSEMLANSDAPPTNASPPTAFAVEGNSKGETPAAIAVGEKPALLSPDAILKDTENFFAAHKERIRMLTLSRRKGYLRPPAKTRRSSQSAL
ncbi:hypothetical protein NPIL_657961 [Nephila pilipes]|uniref:Uncharacterized protein n=1 Tax=Nephila pilipes TaxID=299642 RepID=A0A8X6PAK8_NEPPI|nr:hypothetical protein NPIL_657961 [Nephila pilipes]